MNQNSQSSMIQEISTNFSQSATYIAELYNDAIKLTDKNYEQGKKAIYIKAHDYLRNYVQCKYVPFQELIQNLNYINDKPTHDDVSNLRLSELNLQGMHIRVNKKRTLDQMSIEEDLTLDLTDTNEIKDNDNILKQPVLQKIKITTDSNEICEN